MFLQIHIEISFIVIECFLWFCKLWSGASGLLHYPPELTRAWLVSTVGNWLDWICFRRVWPAATHRQIQTHEELSVDLSVGKKKCCEVLITKALGVSTAVTVKLHFIWSWSKQPKNEQSYKKGLGQGADHKTVTLTELQRFFAEMREPEGRASQQHSINKTFMVEWLDRHKLLSLKAV